MQCRCLEADESTDFSAHPESSDSHLLRLSFRCRHRAAVDVVGETPKQPQPRLCPHSVLGGLSIGEHSYCPAETGRWASVVRLTHRLGRGDGTIVFFFSTIFTLFSTPLQP